MKPIKRIEEPGSKHFQLDLHTDYQQRVYGVVSKIEPEKILLDAADIAKWDAGIKAQSDNARETRAAKESQTLQKKDEARDKIITALFQEIRLAASSPIAARRDAGHQLKLIVDAYKGLQNERWAGKTAHITGLLHDLDKSDVSAAITTLDMAPLITLLRTANNEFKTLRETRSSVAASNGMLSSAEVRKENDRMAEDIFFHIEMAYSMATTEPERKVIGDLIDQVNQRIHEAKTTYNQSAAQRKRHKKKKGGEEPREPKEKEPGKPGDEKKKPDTKEPEKPKPTEPKEPEKPKPGNGDTPKPPKEDEGDDVYIPKD